MSSVNEAVNEHLTIGDIRRRYGINISVPYADTVTVTSIADALEDITPGALYVSSSTQYNPRIVHAAAKRGAYAIAFMITDEEEAHKIPLDSEIPVLFAQLDNHIRARIAADLTGHPSKALAVFAVQGKRAVSVMRELYDLLHYLGNPLGVIDYRGGVSLDRELWLKTPLSPLDVQRMLYAMAEDGATSVIIHIDGAVLETDALSEVDIDVYNNSDKAVLNVPQLEIMHDSNVKHNTRSRRANVNELRRQAQLDVEPYGAQVSQQTACVEISDEAHEIVAEVVKGLRRASLGGLQAQTNVRDFANASALSMTNIDLLDMATAVSMVLEAGVKRTNVKSALRMAYEMKNERAEA